MRPAVKKSISVLAAFFAVWLAARFLLPLCFPFLLGALLAFAAEPMVGFLQKRRVPRCVCSGIGVSMAFCFLAMLVLILCAFALRELRRVAGVLPDLEDTAKSGIGLLQSWLHYGMKHDEEQFVERVTRLTEGTLRHALERSCGVEKA